MTEPSTNVPESIVTSLELSQKLKAAGWAQEGHSWFYYVSYEDGSHRWHLKLGEAIILMGWEEREHYAAPTASEILEMLPGTIRVQGSSSGKTAASKTANVGSIPTPCANETVLYLSITTDEIIWSVSYEEAGGVSKNIYKTDQSLANAAASMFVFLSEHKLLPTS